MDIRRIKRIFFLSLFFVFFPSFFGVYGATISKPANNLGLVGYWSFNEGTSTQATDFSGRGNTGTLTNMSAPASATSGWGSGKLGTGLNFDGTDDYVSTTDIDFTTGGWTLSAWIKTTNTNGQRIFSKGINDGSAQLWFLTFSGGIEMGWFVNSPFEDVTASASVNVADGNWHHMVAVVGASTIQLYVDGVAVGTPVAHDGTPVTNDSNWLIGSLGGTAEFFNGKIDEVRMYNRALTATEVLRQYNTGVIKFNSSKNEVVKNGLVGHWTFDSYNLSDKVYDVSGNSNNGYFQGGSTSTAKTLGKIGQAMNFDGVNDMVNAGSGSTLDDLPGLTYMGWIKPRSAGGGRGTLFAKVNSSNVQGLTYVFFDNVTATNGISFLRDTLTTDISYTTTNNAVSLNEWAHVAVTWDGTVNTVGNVKIYINGVQSSYQISENGIGSLESDAGNDFTIGGRVLVGSERYFDGLIDDVRVYNRAVSATEVKQIYNATAGSKINASQTSLGQSSLNTGLVNMLSFNSKDFSDKVYDRSSSANHGYVYNSATSTSKTIGKSGQGIRFDGVNDFVLQSLSSLGTLTSGTVSVWVYRNRTGVYEIIVEDTVSNISFEGDSPFSMWTANSCQTDFATIPTGQWSHLVGTWNGTTNRTYLNGVQSNATACGSPPSALSRFSIGGRFNGSITSENFSGKMDELRIYNRALTASEVKQLYLIGR